MQLVLFDLDGTLLDTAPDLGTALNTQRAEHNLPPLPQEVIRPVVSHGSPALLKLGFGIEQNDSRYAGMRARLLAIYGGCLSCETRFFPGIETVLQELERRTLRWGVVTNKPGYLTLPLLDKLGLDTRAACVVSGDSCARAKPWPDPLLVACHQLDLAPQDCIYIGDAERDIQAAHACGMPALLAEYGYIGPTDDIDSWEADGSLLTPTDLLEFLE